MAMALAPALRSGSDWNSETQQPWRFQVRSFGQPRRMIRGRDPDCLWPEREGAILMVADLAGPVLEGGVIGDAALEGNRLVFGSDRWGPAAAGWAGESGDGGRPLTVFAAATTLPFHDRWKLKFCRDRCAGGW
jgi:hypothetical protein